MLHSKLYSDESKISLSTVKHSKTKEILTIKSRMKAMKMKSLYTAIIFCLTPTTGVFAAAMDRSGQSISAFLQPNNYFEAGLSILDPTVEGRDAGTSETTRHIEDMGNDYYFPSAAIKLQLTDHLSFGLLYDQPFGADVEYKGSNVFVTDANTTILPTATMTALRASKIASSTPLGIETFAKQAGIPLATAQAMYTNNVATPLGKTKDLIDAAVAKQVDAGIAGVNGLVGQGSTKAEVDSHNLSMIFGFQPNKNLNFYAGGVYQTIEGSLSLRGQATSVYNGYDATLKETDGVGWLVGAAFQIPEIALKASITYRSKIDHDIDTVESLPTLPALALLGDSFATAAAKIATASGDTKISTPQSVNIDLQSGVMKDTVAFANIRWVNWKDFELRPVKFGMVAETVGQLPTINRPDGFNLLQYSKDQWNATVGVGRKLNDHWSGTVSAGWDSGAGNPVTALGPTEGYWNVGLGLQFNPAPNYFIAGGVKYFWLGDAKGQVASQNAGTDYVADFSDNNAIAYGLKIGYKF